MGLDVGVESTFKIPIARLVGSVKSLNEVDGSGRKL